jgi:cell division septal protein FtsQ
VAGVIALVCAAALAVIATSEVQRIESLDVRGARHVSRDHVVAITRLLGAPVFLASASEARQVLLGIPAVRDASVEVTLPGSARISLSEREAAGRWVVGSLEWFIDADGVLFSSVDPTAAPALRVRDERAGIRSAGERIDPGLVAATLRLAKIAPGELRADATAPSVRIRPGPDGIVLETGGGWEVRFGSHERIEEKLELLARFLREQPGRRLEYVDVRSTDRIVFSPE